MPQLRRGENWDIWTYDIWGHSEEECPDGGCDCCGEYEVNDQFRIATVQLSEDPTDEEVIRCFLAADSPDWEDAETDWIDEDRCEIMIGDMPIGFVQRV